MKKPFIKLVNFPSKSLMLPSHFSRSIFNFSSTSLKPAHYYCLALGLKHVFKPHNLRRQELRDGLNRFKRDIRLKYYFRSEPDDPNFIPKLYVKRRSNFNPPADPIIERFLTQLSEHAYTELTLQPQPRIVRDPEKQLITQLIANRNIIIKPADKNLGITVMNADQYFQRLRATLVLPTYRPIWNLRDPNKPEWVNRRLLNIRMTLIALLRRHRAAMEAFNPSYFIFLGSELTAQQPNKIPTIYGLPKIHKLNPLIKFDTNTVFDMRPIVSSTNWITTRASIAVGVFLKPLQDALHRYILKDSRDLVTHLQNFVVPPGSILVSYDIVNFYGNISSIRMPFVLERLNRWLLTQNYVLRNLTIPDWIIDLIMFVLQNNFFTIQDDLFKQEFGMAMGTNMAVIVANLYAFASYELRFLDDTIHRFPFYRRYVDDSLAIVIPQPGLTALEVAQRFLHQLNHCGSGLSFTMEWHPTQLPFLDLKVQLHENRVIFDCFQKALNKYAYITHRSYHPPSLKRGFIKGELIRYARNTTHEEDFVSMKNRFRHRLFARGYTPRFIESTFKSIDHQSRADYLRQRPRPPLSEIAPLVIRYTPDLHRIRLGRVIHRYSNLLVRGFHPYPSPRVLLALKSNVSIAKMILRNEGRPHTI